MKRVKLFLTGLMMSLVILLTSCLDSDPSPLPYSGYATVKSYMGMYTYLETDLGDVVNFNSNLAAAKDITNYERVFFYSTINEENSEESNLKEGEYNVDLQWYYPVDQKINLTSVGSSVDTLRIYPINKIDMGYGIDSYLTLAVDYYIYNTAHSFTLFKYYNEVVRKASSINIPDTLDVYLSHDNLGDDVAKSNTLISDYVNFVNPGYIMNYGFSFNIRNILNSDDEILAKDTIVFNIKGFKASTATDEEGEAYNYPVKVPTKYSYY